MSDTQMIMLLSGLLVAILVIAAGWLIRLNNVPYPTAAQRHSMTLLEATVVVAIAAIILVTAVFAYRFVGLPILVFIGMFAG